MPTTVKQRARKQRNGLRRAGLRRVQIWVPDTRLPGFDEECRRQSLLVSQTDMSDVELQQLLDEAWADLEE